MIVNHTGPISCDGRDRREGRFPDFLIIGAAKCGTTTLYQYLCRHPQVFMSRVKEPCFFDSNVAWQKGFSWYRALFAEATDEQLCGEASTNYTRWPQVPGVPARIAEAIPNVKLIYVMRDPIERAYSHFVHRHTKETHIGEPFSTSFEDFVAADPLCVDGSDYWMQIEQYRRIFPRQAFLFLFFEELRTNPASLLKRICRFLDIDEGIDLVGDRPIHANDNFEQRAHFARKRTTDYVRQIPWLFNVVKRLPRHWRDAGHRLLQAKTFGRHLHVNHAPPSLTAAMRQKLALRYDASHGDLRQFIGKDALETGWFKP